MAASAGWTTWPEVKAALRRRWDDGTSLRSYASGDLAVPLAVTVRAPTPREVSADFGAVQDWVQGWQRARVAPARVETAAVGGRLVGTNHLPRRVWVDTVEDLWALLGVTGDVARLDDVLALTRERAPAALTWVAAHPHVALRHAGEWERLLAVLAWIADAGGPDTYLRQIDVAGVDTKFVETRRGVLGNLLDRYLPEDRVRTDVPVSDFARRYGLRSKPEYVRVRSAHARGALPFSEAAVRVDELAGHPLPVRTVYVVENEITYLALPVPPDAVVMLGGGFAVSRLTPLDWLRDRDLVYWGDLDTHGFAILDRLRAAFPAARSLLMDSATLLAHREHWSRDTSPTSALLPRLTAPEGELYRALVGNEHGESVRLEQERVRFSVLRRALAAPSG